MALMVLRHRDGARCWWIVRHTFVVAVEPIIVIEYLGGLRSPVVCVHVCMITHVGHVLLLLPYSLSWHRVPWWTAVPCCVCACVCVCMITHVVYVLLLFPVLAVEYLCALWFPVVYVCVYVCKCVWNWIYICVCVRA